MSESVADEQSDSRHACTLNVVDRAWSATLAELANTIATHLHPKLLVLSLVDHTVHQVYLHVSGAAVKSTLQVNTAISVTEWSREVTTNLLSGFGEFATEDCDAIPITHTESYSAGILYQPAGDDNQSAKSCWSLFGGLAALLIKQTALHSELQTELEQQKLESLAEFAAGAGHEINNPIATISGRVQLLLQQETDSARRQALSTIGGQALRVRDMIGDLMLYARPPAGQAESLCLSEVVSETIEKLQLLKQCVLKVNLAESLTVWADRYQLCIVFSEILQNALHAANGDLMINLAAKSHTHGDIKGVLIRIEDNGRGLNSQERQHLFDPFYSGRQAGRGIGFGLPKCWRIVNNHGGSIQALPNQGKGLTLEIWWPSIPVTD